MKSGLLMVGLDKAFFSELFTEKGEVKGLNALLQKGVESTQVAFEFDVTSKSANFPKGGKDQGKGTITRHPNGRVDASYDGSLMIGSNQYKWHSLETSKVVEDGKVIKGLEIVSFSNSQKPAWMKNFIMETEMDLSTGTFINTAYEWT